MTHWLDLLSEGDPHPRRFDGPASLRAYLTRVERLDEDAVDELLRQGRVDPPLSRRGLRVQPFPPQDVVQPAPIQQEAQQES